MIKFEIPFVQGMSYQEYRLFADELYHRILITITKKMDSRKYKIRESYILKTPLIKWKYGHPPPRIDLIHYVRNCLILVKEGRYYVIKINPAQRIVGSTTPVSLLIRLLEYGSEDFPPYPLIRSVLNYYSVNYEKILKGDSKR